MHCSIDQFFVYGFVSFRCDKLLHGQAVRLPCATTIDRKGSSRKNKSHSDGDGCTARCCAVVRNAYGSDRQTYVQWLHTAILHTGEAMVNSFIIHLFTFFQWSEIKLFYRIEIRRFVGAFHIENKSIQSKQCKRQRVESRRNTCVRCT